MICRVAEACFWLHRYLERVDSIARALRVNGFFLLDTIPPETHAWRPLLIVSGEEPRFVELHGEEGADDGETVQAYLVWDGQNPASLYNSVRLARENARTVRETISLEMWEATNALWHWVSGGEGRSVYDEDRSRFYEQVQESCYQIQGITYNTMLHEEPFDFMRLGLNLERASQTGRILDVKHHSLRPLQEGQESPAEIMEWQSILRSCSAYEPFFKRSGSILSGPAVAELLLLDTTFPRSVVHCLERARNFLSRIRTSASTSAGRKAAEGLDALVGDLRTGEILNADTLHEKLTEVIDRTADIGRHVATDFFHPPRGGPSAGEGVPADDSALPSTPGISETVRVTDGRDFTGLSTYDPGGVRDHWEIARQRLQVTHTTTYRYDNPIARSSHLLRLRPETDIFQSLEEYDLDVSVSGVQHAFEDVFGNRAALLEVTEPFEELRIKSRSVVNVGGRGQADPYLTHNRPTLPLVWMPWEHQILLPYLLPPELPAYQLRELTDYARTFAIRNWNDLFWTLRDICQTLNREYAYVPGSTHLETTAYEVYQTRRGVCQDFANLFVCLARLHGVPARYRVGYLFTGGRYERVLQSDASHAWAEVYLPWLGWRGFDPTNGILTSMDHIRVARGRFYRDATPTSGIIYQGGGGETLEVDVKVVRLSD